MDTYLRRRFKLITPCKRSAARGKGKMWFMASSMPCLMYKILSLLTPSENKNMMMFRKSRCAQRVKITGKSIILIQTLCQVASLLLPLEFHPQSHLPLSLSGQQPIPVCVSGVFMKRRNKQFHPKYLIYQYDNGIFSFLDVIKGYIRDIIFQQSLNYNLIFRQQIY